MNKRIVLLGANGQVASEVTIILNQLGHDVVPVCRGAMGSSFLRYMGIPVRIGSVVNQKDAARLLSDADIVANFALAGGTPQEMRSQNDFIIENSFRYSSSTASVIFFSTLAVNKGFSSTGEGPGAYGREKIRNERQVERLSKRLGRNALILRLGHVFGEYQGITQSIRTAISSGPVQIPDPGRHANTVMTATIVDAILGVAEGRLAPQGRFDLVNDRRWTWGDLLSYEATKTGHSLEVITCGDATRGPIAIFQPAKSLARVVFKSPFMKKNADKILGMLSPNLNQKIRASYFKARVAQEVAALRSVSLPTIEAAHILGFETTVPSGLNDTSKLLATPGYIARRERLGTTWAGMGGA